MQIPVTSFTFIARRLVPALLACGLAGGAATAAEPAWPVKPIRLVLGVGTGGVGDILMRTVAAQMSEQLGQQLVVENRPSAGGVSAAQAVIKAEPDGYTLMQAGNGVAISAALFKSLSYDILRDFAQVSTVGHFQLVLLATPESKFASVADIVNFAKRNPGKLDIGTTSPGSTQFLAAELFKSVTGISAQTVPFKSNAQIFTAMRGGEVGVAFELIGPAMVHIRAKTINALAFGSNTRFPGLPEVPTMKEAGIDGYNVTSWSGISAPAKTPPALLDRIAREVARAVAVPDLRQKLLDMGIEARASTPAEARALMVADIAKWRELIARAGIEKQ
jgi:tripartite-type tricarboxylate transporter receptor subunit TctC